MKIWKWIAEKFVELLFPAELQQGPFPLIISSKYLERDVYTTLYVPQRQKESWSLLLLNDGQDEERLDLKNTHLLFRKAPENLMIIAIHAGDRIEEYGTADILDYKNRGKKSDGYHDFIIKELLPNLHAVYPITAEPSRVGIAGFSLGALSAIDIAWKYPKVFGFAGVFSGALWWRKAPFKKEDPDADRIMHEKVIEGNFRKQRFWLQAGTKDETADRNNNGIIDAIDDTLHLINLLALKVPAGEKYLKYVEVENGEHNPETWRKVLPEFLEWAFES